MSLEVRPTSSPNRIIPSTRIASAIPNDRPFERNGESKSPLPTFDPSKVDRGTLLEKIGLAGFRSSTESSDFPGPSHSRGFFDSIGGLFDKIPDPLKDLLGDGIKKVGDTLKDLVFGGGDKKDGAGGADHGVDPSASPPCGHGTTGPHAGTSAANPSGTPGSFEEQITALLKPDAQGQVHEEELFAALLAERVRTLAGPDAAQAYEAALQERLGALTRPDGSVPAEQAAIEALKQIRDAGAITPELGDRIYSEAFAAAQLDDNAEALFDDRGSRTDETIATAKIDEAIGSAKEKVLAFDNGQVTAPPRSLDEAAPTGGATGANSAANGPPGAGGPDAKADAGSAARPTDAGSAPPTARSGFLWKPESDKDGNLVVLLPSDISKDARQVVLRDANGDIVGRGKPTGIGNGDRAHFRFDRPGRAFEGPITVEARLLDRSTRNFQVKNPERRVERSPS